MASDNNSYNINSSDNFEGYLVCFNCSGYYELKTGESPDDFEECECGAELHYYSDIEEFISWDVEGDILAGDELSNVFSLIENLKSKAEKRKKVFEELSKKIEIQEDQLIKIKEGKSSILNKIDEKNLSEDINQQKIVLRDIIKEEEADLELQKELLNTLKHDQERLLEIAGNKRKIRDDIPTVYIGSWGIDQRLFIIILLIIVIIIVVYIIF
ncbi:MAG: hypothetical protein QME14_00230 [Methanobacteriaceae archaeon]|nr:hypothetical protein [Methanobacteriaceae archaeon]